MRESSRAISSPWSAKRIARLRARSANANSPSRAYVIVKKPERIAVESGSVLPSSSSSASLSICAPFRSSPLNMTPAPMNAFGIAWALGSPSCSPIASIWSRACLSCGLESGDSPLMRRRKATQKYASARSRRSARSPATAIARSSCSFAPLRPLKVQPALAVPMAARIRRSTRGSSAGNRSTARAKNETASRCANRSSACSPATMRCSTALAASPACSKCMAMTAASSRRRSGYNDRSVSAASSWSERRSCFRSEL